MSLMWWQSKHIRDKDSLFSYLLEAEREKFAALQAQLAGLDRKRDYRFAKEPKVAQQTSSRRVLELSVGKHGIFSRQLQGP
jgi:hypothetical protein